MPPSQFSRVDGRCSRGQPASVSRGDFRKEILPDEFPDWSYLEQDGFADRLAAYRRGDFGYVGVRAAMTVPIPMDGHYILHEIRSPGLWGIESDSGDDYLAEVFGEESHVLEEMLSALGVRVHCVGKEAGR